MAIDLGLAKKKQKSPRFTKGPWKVEGWLIVADRKTKRHKGAIAGIITSATMYEKQWDMNARMLAASPDLLQACQDIQGRIRKHPHSADILPELYAIATNAVNKVCSDANDPDELITEFTD